MAIVGELSTLERPLQMGWVDAARTVCGPISEAFQSEVFQASKRIDTKSGRRDSGPLTAVAAATFTNRRQNKHTADPAQLGEAIEEKARELGAPVFYVEGASVVNYSTGHKAISSVRGAFFRVRCPG